MLALYRVPARRLPPVFNTKQHVGPVGARPGPEEKLWTMPVVETAGHHVEEAL
jgi:hypothetical protein